MEATDWIASVALAVAIGSAVISGLSVRHSRRSADAAERSAQADSDAVALAKEEADRIIVKLHLGKIGNDSYALSNIGEHDAYHLHFDLGDVDVPGNKTDYDVLSSGACATFRISCDQDTKTDHLTVTYSQDPSRQGEQRTWGSSFA